MKDIWMVVHVDMNNGKKHWAFFTSEEAMERYAKELTGESRDIRTQKLQVYDTPPPTPRQEEEYYNYLAEQQEEEALFNQYYNR